MKKSTVRHDTEIFILHGRWQSNLLTECGMVMDYILGDGKELYLQSEMVEDSSCIVKDGKHSSPQCEMV